MKHGEVATRHDVSPEAAIDAIRGHRGPILLDLDETLYLRNSTEDFIDSARPRLPALLLMRLLDLVKPWRTTGGEVTRDVWRVRLISMCFPWTGSLWRKRVTTLATDFTNLRLMAVLGTPGASPIIATAGFEPIVAPLVAALGLPQALITQMAQTAACNRHHSLDQQLCRWLLLSMDRLRSNELVMTQELIANMLGVRREGVTEAALQLQAAGLIRYARGRISVLSRKGLEQRSCECYAVVKKEYDRLLPHKLAT